MNSRPSTRWTALAVALIGLVAAACSPLGLLNHLTPSDGGVNRAAEGVAYGPDPRQKLDVYAPAGDVTGAPVVVFFYGGSWSSGRRQDYAFVGKALASRGFVTVIPDYRLVPKVRFPGFVQDSAAAVRWAYDNARRYGGDRGRLAVMGHSAGAYNAMMVALDPRWLAQAGAPAGVVKAVVGLSGPYDFYPFDVQASQDAFGAWPDPRETQPIRFARADAPPALLIQGLADTTVKPRNSEALAAALRAKGVEVKLELLPKVDHVGTLKPLAVIFRKQAPVLADSVAFLDAHLRPVASAVDSGR